MQEFNQLYSLSATALKGASPSHKTILTADADCKLEGFLKLSSGLMICYKYSLEVVLMVVLHEGKDID